MARLITRKWIALDAVSMASNQTSSSTDLAFKDKGRAYAVWSGATNLTGTLDVQISNDNVTWRTITAVTIPLDSASGSHEIVLPSMDFNYLRFKYTAGTENSGSLTIEFNAAIEGA